MAKIIIPTVFKAHDKYSKVVSKMTKTTRAFSDVASSGIARSERAFRRFTPGLGEANKQMLSMVGTAALVTGALSLANREFEKITGFETGLVGVGKTTGLTGKELKAFGADVVNTSKKLRTISSEKLLELSQSAGQMGIKGSKNILLFASTMAKLEGATDGTIVGSEGASSVARLLTITGEGVGVVDRFASSIVALGNNSAATEGDILSVASEVARSTAAYKLNFKEILGISAALKSLDVRPEAAGTAVGKVFRALELSTIKGGKTLKAFGKIMELTPAQVKETFAKSPTKAFTTFIQGLDKVGKKGGSIAKSLLDVGLSGETVSKGIVPLATKFSLLAEKMKLANSEAKLNKALNAEFGASQKTVASSIEAVTNAFDNLFIVQATQGDELSKLQRGLFWVARNMGTIVKIGVGIIGFFVAWKAAIIAARVAMVAYSVVMGVFNALMGRSALITVGNTIAYKAYRATVIITTAVQKAWAFVLALTNKIGLRNAIVTVASTTAMVAGKIATAAFTAAQWLLNVALTANPIGLIIIAIVALVAIVALIINKYDAWGTVLEYIKIPLRAIRDMIVSVGNKWNAIKKAFTEGGITAGLKTIGKVLLDNLLAPIEKFLQLVSKIPGLDISSKFSDKIADFRADLDINGDNKESGGEEAQTPSLNSEAAKQRVLTETINTNKQTVDLNINDPGGNATFDSSGDNITEPKIIPTFG